MAIAQAKDSRYWPFLGVQTVHVTPVAKTLLQINLLNQILLFKEKKTHFFFVTFAITVTKYHTNIFLNTHNGFNHRYHTSIYLQKKFQYTETMVRKT